MRWTALLALALGGCVLRSSQPARLYVLDAVAPAGPAASTGTVGVLRVTVPVWMDRAEITARSAQGEIVPDALARWGEPVSRGIQRVVAENLARLLPGRHVVVAPFSARDAVDQRVEVTVAEAARQVDGTVLLEARWTISGGAGPVQRRSSHRVTPGAAGAAGTVAALGQALAALSADVAEALR